MRTDQIFELLGDAVHPALFERVTEQIDPEWIREALDQSGKLSVRRRKLPAEVVVWTVIGACLFGERSFVDVVRDYDLTIPTARRSRQNPASSGAIARARARVGSRPFRAINRTAASRWLDESSVGDHRYRGLRVLAVDGTTLDLPDTASNNEAFGKPKVKEGTNAPAFPKARAVVVMETRTRMILDAEIGAYDSSEFSLFEADPDDGLLARLPDRSLTILDRFYRSWGMLRRIASGGVERHWLLRARADLVARPVVELGRGDRLVNIFPGRAARNADATLPAEIVAREITFLRGRTEFRILTSLLDPELFPAIELARLYRERWEIELAFDDVKTEQRRAATTLRSRKDEGVRQEFYALLLAHNVVRFEAAKAAAQVQLPPNRISFHVALRAVARHMHLCSVTAAPSRVGEWEGRLLALLASLVLPPRRTQRVYPRALKRIIARYPRKRIEQPQGSA